MNKYSLFLLMFILMGCKAEYEDVSDEPKYSNLINTEYRILEELLVHGVNLGDVRRQEIDIYIVSKKPGGGGRYIIKKFGLEVGSKIRINKVLHCTNCFPSLIMFGIDILSESLTQEKPIRLVNLSIENDEGELVMDPAIFLKLKEESKGQIP